MAEPILKVDNLKKYFPIGGGFLEKKLQWVKALDGVSFTVNEGETFGVVGESGCGKTTLGRTILHLVEPTEGQIIFQGKDISHLSKDKLRRLRKEMQIIFQDPYASLNGRLKVSYIIQEPLIINKIGSRREQEKKVIDLLEVVGLNSSHASKYPHEFSGGQRQRIGIARALSLNPKLVICDEPVSALDVSIQSQVLNLLKELQNEFALTYIFISHDLSVVRYISDRVAVMYLGKFMELAAKNDLYQNPLHPYTQALLSAIPVPKVNVKKEQIILEGDVPSPSNPPAGCRFSTRCPIVDKICIEKDPVFREVFPAHYVACHKV
jgi:oligopeptide/dipeptide ABC transporter ATP-binding protein